MTNDLDEWLHHINLLSHKALTQDHRRLLPPNDLDLAGWVWNPFHEVFESVWVDGKGHVSVYPNIYKGSDAL